jgi:hypothetical protein
MPRDVKAGRIVLQCLLQLYIKIKASLNCTRTMKVLKYISPISFSGVLLFFAAQNPEAGYSSLIFL